MNKSTKKILVIISLFLSGIICNPYSFWLKNEKSTFINVNKNIPNLSSNSWWNIDLGGAVYSVDISYNGTYIVAGTSNNKIFLFNRTQSTPLWTYETNDFIGSVTISDDGNYIIAGGGNKEIYLFNKSITSPKKPIWSYKFIGDIYDVITSVAISYNGTYMCVSNTTCINLFNFISSNPIWVNSSLGRIYSTAISSNGSYITVGGKGHVYLFNQSSPDPIWKYKVGNEYGRFPPESACVNSVDISSTGEYIAAASDDTQVYYFNKSKTFPKYPIWNFSTNMFAKRVSISSCGNYIASLGGVGKVFYSNKTRSTPLWNYTQPSAGGSFGLDISANGTYIAVGSDYPDATFYLFQNSTNKPLWRYFIGKDTKTVAISSDGKYIAAGSANNKLYLFDRDNPPIDQISYIYDNDDSDGNHKSEVSHFVGYPMFTIIVIIVTGIASILSYVLLKVRGKRSF